MEFHSFSCLNFYHFLNFPGSFDQEVIRYLIVNYYLQERRSEIETKNEDFRKSLEVISNFEGNLDFYSPKSPEEQKHLNEAFFKVSAALGMDSLNWHSKEEIQNLWQSARFWKKIKEPFMRQYSTLESLKLQEDLITPIDLIAEIDKIFVNEYKKRISITEIFLDSLTENTFSSQDQAHQIKELQNKLKKLTYHPFITESHKVQGIKFLKNQMKMRTHVLPADSQCVRAFYQIGRHIHKSLEGFFAVIVRLRRVYHSIKYLSEILPITDIPQEVYQDINRIILGFKNDLRKMTLLTDKTFLEEIKMYFQREGWQSQLLYLIPQEEEFYRVNFSYPKESIDIVDAHRNFYKLVKDFKKAKQIWSKQLST